MLMKEDCSGVRRSRGELSQHFLPLFVILLLQVILIAQLFPPHRLHSHLFYGDTLHTAYLVNWGQQTLLTRPLAYYDIPLFGGLEGLKACTATNPLMELLTAPLRLFRQPVLSYNLMMILNVIFSGITMYICAVSLTHSRVGGVLAAIIFSMNPWMQWHLMGHPNISCPIFIPLSFIFYVRFRKEKKLLWGIFASGFLFLQFTASIYLGVILLIGLLAMYLVDTGFNFKGIKLSVEGCFLFSVLTVLCLVYIFAMPYKYLSDVAGQTRGLNQTTLFSLGLSEYILPPRWDVRPMSILGRAFEGVGPLPRIENVGFAGYTTILLATFSLLTLFLKKPSGNESMLSNERRYLLLAGVLALVGVIFSLGPLLWIGDQPSAIKLPFWIVYEYISPLRFLRAPARFVVLYLFFMAISSAWALMNLRTILKSSRSYWVACSFIFILLLLEYFPMQTPSLHEVSSEGSKALAELPEGSSVAPLPFGSEEWLPEAALSFPSSPSGFDGGIYLYPYQTLKGNLDSLPLTEQVAYLKSIGTDHLYLSDLSLLADIKSIPGISVVSAWSRGAIVDISETKGLEGPTRSLKDLPWRPLIEREPPLEDSIPWTPIRIIHRDSSGEWKEVLGPSQELELIYNDIDDSYGLVAGGVPLAEFAEIAFRFRHSKRGVDYDYAKLTWITDRNPDIRSAYVRRTFVHGGNDWQWVVFKLKEDLEYAPDEAVKAFFISFPGGTYPGLECEVSKIVRKPLVSE